MESAAARELQRRLDDRYTLFHRSGGGGNNSNSNNNNKASLLLLQDGRPDGSEQSFQSLAAEQRRLEQDEALWREHSTKAALAYNAKQVRWFGRRSGRAVVLCGG